MRMINRLLSVAVGYYSIGLYRLYYVGPESFDNRFVVPLSIVDRMHARVERITHVRNKFLNI